MVVTSDFTLQINLRNMGLSSGLCSLHCCFPWNFSGKQLLGAMLASGQCSSFDLHDSAGLLTENYKMVMPALCFFDHYKILFCFALLFFFFGSVCFGLFWFP